MHRFPHDELISQLFHDGGYGASDLTGAFVDIRPSVGLEEVIKISFRSVFEALNTAVETRAELSRLTEGPLLAKWADSVITNASSVHLFATNSTVPVHDLYVRLALRAGLQRERYRSRDDLAHDLRNQKIGADDGEHGIDVWEALDGRALLSWQKDSNGIAIIGGPGTGKSTLLKYVASQVARGRRVRERQRLPLLLTVRDYKGVAGGLEGIGSLFLQNLGVTNPQHMLHVLLSHGILMVLVDGLDETAEDQQAAIIEDLESFSQRYPESTFCVSSRPQAMNAPIGSFNRWEVLPLSQPGRLLLIAKWFEAVGDPAKGRLLTERTHDRPEVLDLGSNPLLLSILCALFHNDLSIPDTIEEVYFRCVEGLLGGWDGFRRIARESPLSNLSIRERTLLAGGIATETLKQGLLVFSSSDVERTRYLTSLERLLRRRLPPADTLLGSLERDFGILVERAPGIYSFTHLTLHEYLAARFVTDNRMELDVLGTYGSEAAWIDVLPLIAKLLLPTADRFMSELTARQLAATTITPLLLTAWRMKPLCTQEVRLDLLAQVASRVSEEVGDCAVTIHGKRFALLKRKEGGTRPGPSLTPEPEQDDRLTRAGMNTSPLLHLVTLLRESGLSPEELGIAPSSPIVALLGQDLRSIVLLPEHA